MKILIAGASGFLGGALRTELAAAGHDVHRLVRREPAGPDEHRWDPDAGEVSSELVAGVDAVVNLAGSPIAQWPWTTARRQEILQSRVRTTGTLARAIAEAPAPPAFVVASGIAFYGGDRGAESLDESSSAGSGFLADVVRAWEAAADPARAAGGRVVHLRTGVVAHRSGGALKLMLPVFRLGLGGRLGSGRQYFALISLRDWVSAVRFLLEEPTAEGPFNVVGLEPPTNAEFTRALARRVHRPAIVWAPERPLRLVLGGLANELFGSFRIRPTRLTQAGFSHVDTDVDSVLEAALTQ